MAYCYESFYPAIITLQYKYSQINHTAEEVKRVGIPLSVFALPHFSACSKLGPGFLLV
jgi:hypothetical protein